MVTMVSMTVRISVIMSVAALNFESSLFMDCSIRQTHGRHTPGSAGGGQSFSPGAGGVWGVVWASACPITSSLGDQTLALIYEQTPALCVDRAANPRPCPLRMECTAR